MQPLAQRLRGREVADAEHELGPVRLRPVRIAQQGVVVRDRRRPAAGARQRIGEHGHARPARRTRRPRRRAPGRAPRARRRRPPAAAPPAPPPARRRAPAPAAVVRRGRVTHGRPPARPPPPGSSCGSGADGTSGSRSAKFRCTGPGRPSSAVQYARQPSWRSQRTRSGVAGCASTSRNHFTALPNSFTWSIVCPAPRSRSSGGRSAVSTSSGTRASWASITAGA